MDGLIAIMQEYGDYIIYILDNQAAVWYDRLKVSEQRGILMFNAENIATVLFKNNPWLTGKSVSIKEQFPQARFQLKPLTKTLVAKQRRHVIITGLRRVGKTTLMKHAIDWLLTEGVPSGNIFYLPCDHPLMESAEIPDIIEAIETNFSPQNTWYLFIDEVHLTKKWNVWLKVIYDQNHNLRIIATGSANPALVRGMSDSGLGRWHEINLPTMSFAEYCHLRNIETIEIPSFPIDTKDITLSELWKTIDNTKVLQPYFLQYMREGGFPERSGIDDLDYVDRLLYNDVFITMLRRDLVRYLEIRKLDAFTRLFRYMIEKTGQIANVTDISKELGDISKDTVSEYLDYFCSFGLLNKAEMIDKGGKKILKAQPKYHIADPALYAIFHKDPLADKTAAGNLVESVVYKHLADVVGTAGNVIGYLRDKKNRNKEIDVVFESNRTLSYVEIKYQDNAVPREADALISVSREKPGGNYFFLTKNSADGGIYKKEEPSPIIALPVHTFVYWVSASE